MTLRLLWLLEKLFYWPARPVMGVSIFLKDLRWGIYYGYPLCCTAQFAFGAAIGSGKLKMGLRGGGVHITATKVYVPCIFHRGRHPQWLPYSKDPRAIRFREGRNLNRKLRIIMTGQQSLKNFYESVKFSNPTLAARMSEDIVDIALYGLADDKAPAQAAVERLRQKARDLPEVHRRVLESALTELGYS